MKKKTKWFEPGRPLGWCKLDSADKRRRAALRSRGRDKLATARALQALSNITQDSETKRKAGEDARYFFRQHKKR